MLLYGESCWPEWKMLEVTAKNTCVDAEPLKLKKAISDSRGTSTQPHHWSILPIETHKLPWFFAAPTCDTHNQHSAPAVPKNHINQHEPDDPLHHWNQQRMAFGPTTQTGLMKHPMAQVSRPGLLRREDQPELKGHQASIEIQKSISLSLSLYLENDCISAILQYILFKSMYVYMNTYIDLHIYIYVDIDIIILYIYIYYIHCMCITENVGSTLLTFQRVQLQQRPPIKQVVFHHVASQQSTCGWWKLVWKQNLSRFNHVSCLFQSHVQDLKQKVPMQCWTVSNAELMIRMAKKKLWQTHRMVCIRTDTPSFYTLHSVHPLFPGDLPQLDHSIMGPKVVDQSGLSPSKVQQSWQHGVVIARLTRVQQV